MNKQRSLELLQAGKAAWSAWATDLIEQRSALERENQWSVRIRVEREIPSYIFEWLGLAGDNELTKSWLDSATLDFSAHTFESDIDFSEFHFPYKVDFSKAVFRGEARFKSTTFGSDVRMCGAEFNGVAMFRGAHFQGSAHFDYSKFLEDGDFHSSIFEDDATFESCKFSQRGWFGHYSNYRPSEFRSRANFLHCTFEVGADFDRVKFQGPALFQKSVFGKFAYFYDAEFGAGVFFNETSFGGWTNFAGATFRGDCNFEHIVLQDDSILSLEKAEFAFPPGFYGARLNNKPRLDNVVIRPVGADKRFKDAGARFRILRAFAAASGDFENELKFHAEELRAARLHQDGPLRPRFWFSLLYEVVSDYGRSLGRPIACWFLLFCVFTVLYLGESRGFNEARAQIESQSHVGPFRAYLIAIGRSWKIGSCVESTTGGEALSYAVALSRRSALAFPGIIRPNEDQQIFSCLYGVDKRGNGIIPPSISLWSSLQSVGSGILLFLFGLAVRNMLRMK
jgi:uncharacterized protein YjbI with pentapeptide repeats